MITPILFILLTFITAGLAIRSLQAHAKSGTPKLRLLSIGIMSWLVLTAIMVKSGALTNYSQFPTPAMRVMIPGVLLTALFAFSNIGAGVAATFSFRSLILFQAFRFPLELMLYLLHREGHIPVEMTFSGLNFDVLTGLSALLLFFVLKGSSRTHGWIWVWNVSGLLLLINIVTIAILSMPGQTHLLNTAVPNTLISEFPYVWITFFVLAALFGHLVIFRKLQMRSEAEPVAAAVAA